MIRISTRGRYALRAMLDLAEHGHNGPVSRQELAQRQDISADYVAQLFRHLQAAGLAEGVKGPGGGYRLARDANRIRAGDIVQAVEGPIAVVACVSPCPDQGSTCSRIDSCAAHRLWRRVSQALADELDAVTLEDLCAQSQELAGPRQ
jgi:Rrf2 family iron-sulfur cluster assembly transcriptional regulator